MATSILTTISSPVPASTFSCLSPITWNRGCYLFEFSGGKWDKMEIRCLNGGRISYQREGLNLNRIAHKIHRIRAAPSDVSEDITNVEENSSEVSETNVNEGIDFSSVAPSAGLWLLWAGIAAYAILLSPNQTPYQDQYFLEKLLNLKGDDGFQMNAVLVSVFNLMGVWPLVYSQLLIPSARNSDGKPPVWPFSAASYFFGVFALLPYFALWKGGRIEASDTKQLTLAEKVLDSKITAISSLVGAVALIAFAITSGDENWKEYYQYFRGSRFIHVTSIDFVLLTLFAPFWTYNDMAARNWEKKDGLGLALLAIPMIGPIIYLCLRPGLTKDTEKVN